MKPLAKFTRMNGHVEKWAVAITVGASGRLSRGVGANLFMVRDGRILTEHRWLDPMSRPERKHVFEAA
jgi:hypothetical protein